MVDAVTKLGQLKSSVGRVIKGKAEVIDWTIAALLARGHVLIEDVPGVGKTTLAQALARSLNLAFSRIQFTSDTLPSDVIGVSLWRAERGEFEFLPGPIFTNILLADEINRATPKTQAALLEAMNERTVTVEKTRYRLREPFMVLATQNPVEYLGTYPLPESQLDRFLLRISLGYPAVEEELELLRLGGVEDELESVAPVLSEGDVVELQGKARQVRIAPSLAEYLLELVQRTRRHPGLALGVSTRGALALQRACQALALVEEREYVIPDDIARMVVPVLAHRVLLAGGELGEGWSRSESEREIIREVLSSTPVPL
ncbi:MAG: MoxR family ATPase [Thermoanaerobaculaceae bacterium]|nr:MoxR family ATPase [Thermoanaerobaculaceae bacterium]MDI9622611.1 MoxR family ATPase [Acidobacteriota bacterium]NLH10001.1 MoxR family ATPase [Holophagae bacterium]HPW54640.1 MoxR family ATPase [Thermoanaerobaculaceae bacterium]